MLRMWCCSPQVLIYWNLSLPLYLVMFVLWIWVLWCWVPPYLELLYPYTELISLFLHNDLLYLFFTLLDLKFILSDVSILNYPLFWFLFAWKHCFLSLYLQYICAFTSEVASCRYYILGSWKKNPFRQFIYLVGNLFCLHSRLLSVCEVCLCCIINCFLVVLYFLCSFLSLLLSVKLQFDGFL